MGNNPNHKQRSDGAMLGGKDGQRRAKAHRVTGVVPAAKRSADDGATRLSKFRFVRRLLGG